MQKERNNQSGVRDNKGDIGQSHFAPEVSAIKPTMSRESNTQTSWMRQKREKVATHTHTPVAAIFRYFFAAPAINRGATG